MWRRSMRIAALGSLAGVAAHYAWFWIAGGSLWPEVIGEWIMARTPSTPALLLLEKLGAWAKPFAVTGGLAALGVALWISVLPAATGRGILASVLLGLGVSLTAAWSFAYHSVAGYLSFWAPALGVALSLAASGTRFDPGRRKALTAIAMASGAAAVLLENFWRNRALARRAASPVELFPFTPPRDSFGQGLARKAVTPVREFYAMSKNAVDPVIEPGAWKLRITLDGRMVRQLDYAQILSLPRRHRFVTLRCVSNNLQSDLMGNALWTGVGLSQIVDPASASPPVAEVAFLGADGHGDSLAPGYAFSGHVLLAVAMNGKTLDRTHGFPLRVIAPRYYGFKHVKWLSEIALVSRPYFGTWPRMGYTKEPLIHTCSHIDRIERHEGAIRVAGVSFAGGRGIRRVRLRSDRHPWTDAELETPLSSFAWTRWYAELPAAQAHWVEAQALDGEGRWQAAEEGELFPGGVSGPTIRTISFSTPRARKRWS